MFLVVLDGWAGFGRFVTEYIMIGSNLAGDTCHGSVLEQDTLPLLLTSVGSSVSGLDISVFCFVRLKGCDHTKMPLFDILPHKRAEQHTNNFQHTHSHYRHMEASTLYPSPGVASCCSWSGARMRLENPERYSGWSFKLMARPPKPPI